MELDSPLALIILVLMLMNVRMLPFVQVRRPVKIMKDPTSVYAGKVGNLISQLMVVLTLTNVLTSHAMPMLIAIILLEDLLVLVMVGTMEMDCSQK